MIEPRKVKTRKEVNFEIRAFWQKLKLADRDASKKLVNRDPLKKKKIPSFTRHNGRKILRLKRKEAWRRPKGSHGNKVLRPKVGYKNDSMHRFRKINGVRILLVENPQELLQKAKFRKDFQVFSIAKRTGAKKRAQMLQLCVRNRIPLYITK